MNTTRIVLAAALCFLVHAFDAQAAPKKVGVVLPLSGPLAELGAAVKNGLVLGASDTKGGDEVTFLFEDDQFDPVKSVTATRKLMDVDGVDAFVVVGSGPSLAVAPMIERAKLPAMSISTSQKVTQGRRYVFRHWLDPDTEGKLLAAEAKRRGYADVAIVTTEGESMIATRDGYLRNEPPPTVFSEEVLPNERDFGALADRIRAKNPAAVFLCTMTPQGGLLAVKLREHGYRGALFSAHPLEIDPVRMVPGGALEGVWFVSNDERAAEEFGKTHRARFGTPPGIGAANGYDMAVLLIAALRSSEPAEYLRAVRRFEGLVGTYDATSDGGFTIPAAVRIVKGSEIIYGASE